MDAKEWLKKVGSQLKHTCNGSISSDDYSYVGCNMDNGVVIAGVFPGDKSRFLKVEKDTPDGKQTVKMESYSDEMVITRSLSGSIEFLHKSGAPPEVRIEQNKKEIGMIKINAHNDKVKTSLYGSF